MSKCAHNGIVILLPDRCDFCGTCVAVCPVDCIELAEYRLTIDLEVCTLCMNCVHVCPVGALTYQEGESVEVSGSRV